MEIKEYRIEKLKRLLGYLENFEKDYENVTKLSYDIEDINNLGSMIDYPFHKSLDKMNVKKWISKFKNNIQFEIEKESSNE